MTPPAEPTWLDLAQQILAVLAPLIAALAVWLRARAARAEAERDVVIEGVERSSRPSETKHRIQIEASKRGIEPGLRESVQRVTKRIGGAS